MNNRNIIIAVLLIGISLAVILATRNQLTDVSPGVPAVRSAQSSDTAIQEVPALSTKAVSTRAPDIDERMKQMEQAVNDQLLPVLYASNDIDALITGAMLLQYNLNDHYSKYDFLTLGLSLEPDDLVLLSTSALECMEAHRQQKRKHLPYVFPDANNSNPDEVFQKTFLEISEQRDLFCDGRSFVEDLVELSGENAWVWALQAVAKTDDPDLSLEYLEKAAQAPYYGDYSLELRLLMMGTLQRYGDEIEDTESLQQYGIFKLLSRPLPGSGFLRPCSRKRMETDRRFLDACLSLTEYSIDASTVLEQSIRSAIKLIAADIKGEPLNPDEYPWLNRMGSIFQDPEATAFYVDKVLLYSEFDAIKQTLIHFNLIEDTGEIPQEIKIQVVE